MGFERRHYNYIQLCLVASIIISGALAAFSFYKYLETDGATFEVSHLSIKTVPKAKLIPTSHQNGAFKADISNAALSQKSKKPVVITL
jgi:hypothetical protein